jgi:hypothetical protein
MKKNARDTGSREEQKNAGERQPHQRSISPERCLRGAGTHLLDAKAQKQHCAKRRQHDQPDQRRPCIC